MTQRLSRTSWQHHTKDLPEGRSLRRDHDCGDGRTLLVSHGAKGYSAWCFRCGAGDSLPPPHRSPAERLARIKAQQSADTEAQGAGVDGMNPRVQDVYQWPEGARLWLARAGLGAPEITRLGAWYHPPTERVVVPVYGPYGLIFWQARAWQEGRQPKYMAPHVPKRFIYQWGQGEATVLCEDMLSAYKVGGVARAARAVCLFGTVVPDVVLADLLNRGGPVLVWLDPDAAGSKGSTAAVRKLRSAGLTVRAIRTDQDPKLLTCDEIRRAVQSP